MVVAGPVDGQRPRVAVVDGAGKYHSGRAGNRRRRGEAGIRISQVEVGDVEGPGVRQRRERHLARGRERAGEPVAERLRARADEHRRAAVVEHDRAEPVPGESELRRQVGDRAFVDGKPGGARRRHEGDVDVTPVVDRVDVDGAARARIGERGRGALHAERRDDLVVRRSGDHVAVLQRHVGVLEAAGVERHRHGADREFRERRRRITQQVAEPVGPDLADGGDQQLIGAGGRQVALLLDHRLLRQRRDRAHRDEDVTAGRRLLDADALDAEVDVAAGVRHGRQQLRVRRMRIHAAGALPHHRLAARAESRHALHTVDRLELEGHGDGPRVRHDRIEWLRLAGHGDGGAVGGHGELGVVVEDRRVVERGARRRVEAHVDEALAARRVIGAVHGVDVDAATALHGVDHPGRRRGGGRRRRRGVDDVKGHFLAGGVAEARLQLSVQGQQPHLVRDVGQEEHHDLAAGDVAEVGVEPATDADAVVGEVQLADDEELPVRADLDDDLGVEDLLRGIEGVQLRAPGDDHR